jgi:uncharacterized protein (TIGR00369 family)
MDIHEVQELITAKVPLAHFIGLEVEEVGPGNVRLRLPFAPQVENHLGIVYAGAIFALAEIAGGVAMLSAFDAGAYTVLIRRFEIDYVRPSRRDLFCDLRLPDERIAEARAAVAERGNADLSLPIEVTDLKGRVIARVQASYYLRRL